MQTDMPVEEADAGPDFFAVKEPQVGTCATANSQGVGCCGVGYGGYEVVVV